MKIIEMNGGERNFVSRQGNGIEPSVCICSLHPIAAQILKDAIGSDGMEGPKTRLLTTWHDLAPQKCGELLLLDGCCQFDWPKFALRWEKSGGKVLVLLPADKGQPRQQLQALYLGVSGVVLTSSGWQDEVLQAVKAVLDGGLWIHRDVLNEYVRRTSGQSRNRSTEFDPPGRLTAREEQIMSLLLRGDSNKEIGSTLEISERTVKYHVSNILQKSQVSSRRELLNSLSEDGGFRNCTALPALEVRAT